MLSGLTATALLVAGGKVALGALQVSFHKNEDDARLYDDNEEEDAKQDSSMKPQMAKANKKRKSDKEIDQPMAKKSRKDNSINVAANHTPKEVSDSGIEECSDNTEENAYKTPKVR